MSPGELMAAELSEQPRALQRLLDHRPELACLAAVVASFSPRFVVIAARGTSDHAALHMKYLIENTLGLPVALASMSSLTILRARPRYEQTLWVAVSQSGGSPDLIESTRIASECGALTLAVTNAADSDLARTADLHLDVLAGPERAVAATKSYTSELLALWLLVDLWRGGNGDAAVSLPGLATEVLERRDYLGLVETCANAASLVTTGRGYSYATAREAALKLMETAYLPCQAFSAADLLHGPLAMVNAGQPVVVIRPPDPATQLALDGVLQHLVEREALVCLVGAPSDKLQPAVTVPLPPCDPELAPVLEILPLQQAARATGLARGIDPDAPRGLSKVTRTW